MTNFVHGKGHSLSIWVCLKSRFILGSSTHQWPTRKNCLKLKTLLRLNVSSPRWFSCPPWMAWWWQLSHQLQWLQKVVLWPPIPAKISKDGTRVHSSGQQELEITVTSVSVSMSLLRVMIFLKCLRTQVNFGCPLLIFLVHVMKEVLLSNSGNRNACTMISPFGKQHGGVRTYSKHNDLLRWHHW